jgi:hypothetical protein
VIRERIFPQQTGLRIIFNLPSDKEIIGSKASAMLVFHWLSGFTKLYYTNAGTGRFYPIDRDIFLRRANKKVNLLLSSILRLLWQFLLHGINRIGEVLERGHTEWYLKSGGESNAPLPTTIHLWSYH